MQYSTLQPLSYSTPLKNYSDLSEWQGQRSCRFGRSIRFEPRRDLIQSNFDMPDQTPRTGRAHFNEPSSLQRSFRSAVHKVPPIKHWHARPSKIRCMEFKPSEAQRRAERLHNIEGIHNPQSRTNQSLRTFQGSNAESSREYSVENRMQTKERINQADLRRHFYKDITIFNRS